MPTEQEIKEWLRNQYADQHTADIIWGKMSKALHGSTASYTEDGEFDIYKEDVVRAYKIATGKQVPAWSWD